MRNLIIILVLVLVASSAFLIFMTKETKTSIPVEKWCEVGEVGSDGNVTYQGPKGISELVLVATANGPRLMALCDNEGK